MTKTEMMKHVRDLLWNNKIGTVFIGEDLEFLTEYFSHHPEWELKRGCGIDFFFTAPDSYGKRCFCIRRKDKSETDISLNVVYATAWGKTKAEQASLRVRQDLRKACRHAVQPIIDRFRAGKTSLFVCPISGSLVNPVKDGFDVDHYDENFSDVVEGWLATKTATEQEHIKSCINQTEDGCMETYFTDKAVVDDFIEHHRHHTHLRAVSKIANRRKGRSRATMHDIFMGGEA